MKKMLLMAVLALMSVSVNAQVEPICNNPEVMPHYVDGDQGLFKVLLDNMQYPQDAEKQKIEGRVVVQLTIEKDGSVSAHKVVHSVSPSLDAEAVRVTKLLKKWTPAKNKGKVVRTNFTSPVVFRLK